MPGTRGADGGGDQRLVRAVARGEAHAHAAGDELRRRLRARLRAAAALTSASRCTCVEGEARVSFVGVSGRTGEDMHWVQKLAHLFGHPAGRHLVGRRGHAMCERERPGHSSCARWLTRSARIQLEGGTAAVARGLVAACRDFAHRFDHRQQERRVKRVTLEGESEAWITISDAPDACADPMRSPNRATSR